MARPSSPPKPWRWIGIAAAAAFLASILWSMWVDTLRPVVRSGDMQGAALTGLGLAFILGGLFLILKGGWMTTIGGLRFLGSPEAMMGAAMIRTKADGYREARRANLRRLWRAVGPGALLMLAAFGCFGLGGWLINL